MSDKDITASEVTVKGYESICKTVVPTGSGAHVYVPRQWMGKKVVVVRIT
jgi:putative transposon-encoded protein